MDKASRLRIVVADDDELNLYVLKRTVSDKGHDVTGFSGGIPTWEYLQKNPQAVDMVILDKMMDDMNGLEIIKNMKAHDILKHIPIIIQSGDVFPDQIEASLKAGADHYVTKPYDGNVLIKAVDSLMERACLGSS